MGSPVTPPPAGQDREVPCSEGLRSGHVVCPRCHCDFDLVQDDILEPFLTPRQVSHLLGVPQKSVYDLAARVMPAEVVVHIESRVRFRRREFEAWRAALRRRA